MTLDPSTDLRDVVLRLSLARRRAQRHASQARREGSASSYRIGQLVRERRILDAELEAILDRELQK